MESGQVVGIPCDVSEGPFPSELLVIFETMTGTVSGFVHPDYVAASETGQSYLRGVIKDVDEDRLSVWVRGSFFTTSGLAYFSKDTDFMALAA